MADAREAARKAKAQVDDLRAAYAKVGDAPQSDDRSEMQERRSHGLKARHETREARAVRKQVAEEIATAAEEAADDLDLPVMADWLDHRDWFKDQLHKLAAVAREIGSEASDG